MYFYAATIVALKQQIATGSLLEIAALSVAYPRARKVNSGLFTKDTGESDELPQINPDYAVTA